jgi:hypothetical protein
MITSGRILGPLLMTLESELRDKTGFTTAHRATRRRNLPREVRSRRGGAAFNYQIKTTKLVESDLPLICKNI